MSTFKRPPKIVGLTDTYSSHDRVCLEPLLGATMCLMTHWITSQDNAVATKITLNLESLVSHPNTSENFKLVCERLRKRWSSMQVQSLH